MSNRQPASPGRTRPVLYLALAALVLLAVGVAARPSNPHAAFAAPAEPLHAVAPEVSWAPSAPAQGDLFVLRVHDTSGVPIAAVQGRAADEPLHFAPTEGGGFESFVPIPVEASGTLEVTLTVRYPDGRTVDLPRAVPIAPGDFRHERLTVAPRFGQPPSPEDQARLASDQAKARAVSEAAHRTPRLWTPTFVVPRDDRVTSGFGNGREFNGQITSRHLGLDLDGEPGDTVYATTRGVVELVDDFLLAGRIVYLNHGAGLVTGYFHLSEQLVAPGDTVVAGTPIGRVGATGRVTGPHLHWVVRYGHVSVDPRSLLAVMGVPVPR